MNLVFASGFLVPQHFLPQPILGSGDYFRGLKELFEPGGKYFGKHKAIFPPVSPVGPCDMRAGQLAPQIRADFPDGEIHIIAHSMGGLDCRVLIDRNLEGLSTPGRIKSLSMISTPHGGSPVADLLAGARPGDVSPSLYDLISDAVGKAGIDIGALRNLTKAATSALPDVAKTHPHIRYRSYFASGRPHDLPLQLATCLAFVPTHKYIQFKTGQENDGLVALDSAKYGEFQQSFWQCDHADAVGYNLDGIDLGFKFDHLAHYDAIISQL